MVRKSVTSRLFLMGFFLLLTLRLAILESEDSEDEVANADTRFLFRPLVVLQHAAYRM